MRRLTPLQGQRNSLFCLFLGLFACLFFLTATNNPARSADVVLKNGHVIPFVGKPIPARALTRERIRKGGTGSPDYFPYTEFNAVSRRYYLPQFQVAEVQLGDQFREEFLLRVRPSSQQLMVSSLGGFSHAEPFSDFGRRNVTLYGADKPIEITQAISKIRPDYVELTALTHQWKYSVATSTMSPDLLRKVLPHAISTSSPGGQLTSDDRLAIARFFVQAQMYGPAQRELEQIVVDFPDQQTRGNSLALEIRQLQAVQILNELRRRLDAGQFDLVAQLAERFPRRDVSQSTLVEIDRILQDHRNQLEQIDKIRSELSRLQAEVKDEKLLTRFRDIRSVIDSRISQNTLERLAPFYQTLDDNSLKPEEKLALAFSGWVVGPALADTDPDTALNYWDAKDCMSGYLLAVDPARQAEWQERLKQIEGIGVGIAEAIVRHLGPIYETPGERTGVSISLETLEGQKIRYRVMLPHEYSPDREYPAVLALHAGGVGPEQELMWWGGEGLSGPAHRNGYLVIAPEYNSQPAANSEPVVDLSTQVEHVLRDARRRFSIDSNRVFLAGHGLGGNAVFEVGMSRPHLFAGAIAILGRINNIARNYWENASQLPFYVVAGELDGETPQVNADTLERMMRHRHDIILAEYVQRGREDYYEELPSILEWMHLHQRAALPQEIEMRTLRASDNRFFWLEFQGIPEQILSPPPVPPGTPQVTRTLQVKAKVNAGNTIYLTAGVGQVTMWLSPDFMSFENRLRVNWKGKVVYSDIPEPSIPVMLEHLKLTGDRDRLFWQKLVF